MRLAGSALLIVTLAAGLVGCGESGPQAVTPVLAAAEPSSPSSAPAASTRPGNSSFVASGPLIVEDQVDVSAQRSGVVLKILADVGQPVRKGQLLALLDDRQLTAQRDADRAQLLAAEANLKDWEAETKMAEADFRRADGMYKAQLNTREQLDHARYKWEGSRFEIEKAKQQVLRSQATLQAAGLELDKTRIRAPFGGVVARRYISLGQQVGTGDRTFWVTAVSPLRVKFTLPQSFIGHIRRGQLLNVSCMDTPGIQHAARVIQVSPVVDPSSGTFEVLAQLLHPGRNLRPGMTADIQLENQR